jgi:hypothetical protein
MPVRPLRRYASLLVLLVLALAACLRFWGIDQGLPFPNARPDEREALEHTIGFPAGDLNPRWFVYPNLFFWVVWLWEESVLAVRRLLVAIPDYATLVRTDLPLLILQGRLLSAALGTATVAIVYGIARRLGGPALGLVAGLLLATNLLHVRDSHALKADVYLAAGVPIVLWCLARYTEAPTRGRAIGAGLAIGVTTALKYPGILLLGPAYVAGILVTPRGGVRRFVPSADILILGAVAIATFLAASPYLLLDFERARSTAEFSMLAIYATRPLPHAAPPGSWLAELGAFLGGRAFVYHAGVSLRHGCGLAVALASPLAVAAAWRRPRVAFLVLSATFAVLYGFAVGISPVRQSRYLTPLVPLLAVLLAHLVLVLGGWFSRPAARAALAAGLTLLLVAEPALDSVRYDRIVSRTDTRVLATRWMAANLPPGAVVAELGSIVFPIADPELPPGARRAVVPLGATDLARYGVTHVVTHEHPLPFSTLLRGQMRALAPHLRLLVDFRPSRDGPTGLFEREDAYYVPLARFDAVERPGPLVRIYQYEASP